MKTLRNIVEIDEERCNGCGLCIPNCPEGALRIINGKAKLEREIYCDGLGACIRACPRGAITIEEREAEKFDEEAVKQCLTGITDTRPHEHFHQNPPADQRTLTEASSPTGPMQSVLGNWPIQLMLASPRAPFFQGTDLLLVADCVPFAYANFHQDFLQGKSIVIGCPKLDDTQFSEKKLIELFSQSKIKSVTVINMEVFCCHGLYFLAQKAVKSSGKDVPLRNLTISIKGERMN